MIDTTPTAESGLMRTRNNNYKCGRDRTGFDSVSRYILSPLIFIPPDNFILGYFIRPDNLTRRFTGARAKASARARARVLD